MDALLKEIDLYSDTSKIYHYTNNGQYPYIRPEFNQLICKKDVEQSPFILEVANYARINRQQDILYTRGDLEEFTPYKIGEGAEAIVVNNTPFSVLKIMLTSPTQMLWRNRVPTAMPCQIRGVIEHGDSASYLYFLPKVRVVELAELSYYFKKIDIEMMKHGFFLAIGCSDDVIRVYTDGFTIIDDVGIGNIGVGLDGKVHIIDCNVVDVDLWEEVNESHVANKVACIGYNIKKYGLSLNRYCLLVTEDVNSVIKAYEKLLDDYLADKGINFKYEHIEDTHVNREDLDEII